MFFNSYSLLYGIKMWSNVKLHDTPDNPVCLHEVFKNISCMKNWWLKSEIRCLLILVEPLAAFPGGAEPQSPVLHDVVSAVSSFSVDGRPSVSAVPQRRQSTTKRQLQRAWKGSAFSFICNDIWHIDEVLKLEIMNLVGFNKIGFTQHFTLQETKSNVMSQKQLDI